MPCYTPPPTHEETRAYWERELRHNSPVAELLCTACKLLAAHTASLAWPADLLCWWTEHQARDQLKNR
jgi:hypothetical protein